jgi:hypothetical protein
MLAVARRGWVASVTVAISKLPVPPLDAELALLLACEIASALDRVTLGTVLRGNALGALAPYGPMAVVAHDVVVVP